MKRSLQKYYMRAKRAQKQSVNESCLNSYEIQSQSELQPGKYTSDCAAETYETESNSSVTSSVTGSEDFHFENNINGNSTIQLENVESSAESKPLRVRIAEWAVKYNIPNNATNDLLKILHDEVTTPLPLDARTLLRTVRSVEVKTVAPGKYYHFGLKQAVEDLINCLHLGKPASQPPKIQKFKKKFEKEGALAINADKENRGNYIEPIVELVAAGRSTRNDVVSDPVEMENLTQSGSQEEKLCGGASCKTLKSLVQQGHMLRVLVSDTLSEVKNLRTDLHLINLQKPINQTRNIFNNSEVKFPIEQDEDFNSVEDILRSEEEFNKAIPELSKLGGGSVYDYVKRVFGLIMTDEYAVKYSWLGRKGKRAFKNCNLAKLILKSADATGLPKSHKDIEIAIQNWLRRATDRRHFAQTKKKY